MHELGDRAPGLQGRLYGPIGLDIGASTPEGIALAKKHGVWLDMDVYASFSSQIDAIRARGPGVPSLTVPLLHLVIAHSELVCTLWQNASVGGGAAQLKEVQARHADAVARVRALIARILRSD